MILIIKPEYTVSFYSNGLKFFHITGDGHEWLHLRQNVDVACLLRLLHTGLDTASGSSSWSDEQKTVISIYKKKPELFEVITEPNRFHRIVNMRAVMNTAVHSGKSKEDVQHYRDHFHEQELVIIDDTFGAQLLDVIHASGLEHARRITETERSGETPLQEETILLVNDRELDETRLCDRHMSVIYSEDKLQIGPVFIPGLTACRACYRNITLETSSVPRPVPAYQMDLMFGLLTNTLYYLNLRLFYGIYEDVGLPIKKYYTLLHPGLNIKVTNVYKRGNCNECLNGPFAITRLE